MGAEQPCTIRLDLPALLEHLNVVGACLAAMLERVKGLADPEVTIHDIQLAVQEICVNIVEHAHSGQPGRIEVAFTLTFQPCRLTIETHDFGRSFDPSQVSAPDLDHPKEHGLGLFLVHSLMDEVTYTPQPGDNRWRLVKNLSCQ